MTRKQDVFYQICNKRVSADGVSCAACQMCNEDQCANDGEKWVYLHILMSLLCVNVAVEAVTLTDKYIYC